MSSSNIPLTICSTKLHIMFTAGIHEAFQYVAESLVKGFLANTTDSLLESDVFALRVNARIQERNTNAEEEDVEELRGWCGC